MMSMFAAFVLGGATWTVSEYLLHRFVGHGPRREPPATLWRRVTPAGFLGAFNDEHLRHHADARYFAPTSQKLTAAAFVVIVLGALGSVLVGRALGGAYAVGFVMVYGAYEIIHRRIHTHGPRGRYSRWQRRHHLFHHFKTPRLNHGVTSPVWDKVWGTEVVLPDDEPLRVPRHLAPPWMIASDGTIHAAYAGDYRIAGRESSDAVRRVPARASHGGESSSPVRTPAV